ncbi:P-loop containing nucleoside triphosphate hydrolase protein, partial [Pelagophyceae sp. CCMP2097]
MPAAAKPHQRDAVAATVRCLRDGGSGDDDGSDSGPKSAANRRARVVLPSGAGKTLVGLWVLEALTPPTGVALVVLPRRALIEQTLRSYRDHSTRFLVDGASVLVVASDCSDKSVRCTTDATEIAHFLAEAHRGPRLLLSTYDCLKRIGEADASIDAAVFDEAHHMAGQSQLKYTLGLDDAVLPIRRRLFLTATPRIFPRAAGDDVRSMGNAKIFGREAYRMTYREAVDQGIIVPVKLLICNVTEAYAALCTRKPDLRVLLDDDVIPRADAEVALATLDACERYGLKKAVSFHSTNDESTRFQGHADLIFKKYLQIDEAHAPGRMHATDVARVSGRMHATEREAVLDRFRISEFSLVTNARLLSEGIDVPDVDLVVLASPRKSHVDILQMSGRAACTSPGKEVGYVLLPARSLNDALDEGDYTFAVNVLRTFLEEDEQLQQRLRAEAESAGREGREPDVARVFEDRVEFVGFIDAVSLMRALSTAVPVDPWDVHYGRLTAYQAEHGDCLVPQSFATADGNKLGSCVSTQRTMHKGDDGGLSKEWTERLEAVGFVWDAQVAAWDEGYERLKAYKAAHGDCLVPKSFATADGYKLGSWVDNQRQKRKGNR